MNEDIEFIFESTEELMNGSLDHLNKELLGIRAGKANPHMVDGVMVDYYGSMAPLSQVANISIPDARTIAIQPWEKGLIGAIEKAILVANIGITPMNNGEVIRLSVPPLTEERRRDFVKKVRGEGEHAKISIRNARKEAIDSFKKMQKDGLSEDLAKDAEARVQKITDGFNAKVEVILVRKEEEIMTI
ncbi:MAG: ribosome recycling factor [Bacteroidales bacterium]|nr:ribosome recycling factor [Bacteroidales bacterium]